MKILQQCNHHIILDIKEIHNIKIEKLLKKLKVVSQIGVTILDYVGYK